MQGNIAVHVQAGKVRLS